MKRIGRWTYQPDSRSWKLDGFSYWLISFSILSTRSYRDWCSRCLFSYVREHKRLGSYWGTRYDYRRWRLYTIPPQLYCHHGGKYPHSTLPRTLSSGVLWLPHGAQWHPECGLITYRTGWDLTPPERYWHTAPLVLEAGCCTHQRLLRDAMRMCERALIKEAEDAINVWAKHEQHQRQHVVDALAALGGI